MFSLEVLEKQFDMASPEGKTEFMKEAARRLGTFDEEIERNNYIEAVAKTYKVSFEDLRKLVAKMAVVSGLAVPVKRAKKTEGNREKEDGNLKSQKILLTWMIEDMSVFAQVKKYISPEDFPGVPYRKVAELLYEQYEAGRLNPAQILNYFTEEEEHKEAASLFHTKIKELSTKEEQEKALKETVIRVKNHSIEEATRALDPTDIKGLQRLMEAKKDLQKLQQIQIFIN